MLKRNIISEVRCDETADYRVVLARDYTVLDLLPDLLRANEYGNIYIKDPARCRYSQTHAGHYTGGVLTSEPPAELLLSRGVSRVVAVGGWSKMDYVITLVNENVEIKERIIAKLLNFDGDDYQKLYPFLASALPKADYNLIAQYIPAASLGKRATFPRWLYGVLCETAPDNWRVSPDKLLEILN